MERICAPDCAYYDSINITFSSMVHLKIAAITKIRHFRCFQNGHTLRSLWCISPHRLLQKDEIRTFGSLDEIRRTILNYTHRMPPRTFLYGHTFSIGQSHICTRVHYETAGIIGFSILRSEYTEQRRYQYELNQAYEIRMAVLSAISCYESAFHGPNEFC